MSVKNRIKEFCKFENIAISTFEKSINVSNGYVNSISKSIGIENIESILEIYSNLNIEWLLTGKGDMIKKNHFEKNFLNTVNEPSVAFGKPFKQDLKPAGIPLLPFDAFAGSGYELMDGIDFDTIEERYEIPLFEGLQVDFMIPVRGSSMYPKYNSGDVVACRMIKELLFIQWNKVYVIDTLSQGVVMKRLKKSEHEDCIICKSDNKDYDEFELPKSEIRSVALVVGVVRLE